MIAFSARSCKPLALFALFPGGNCEPEPRMPGHCSSQSCDNGANIIAEFSPEKFPLKTRRHTPKDLYVRIFGLPRKHYLNTTVVAARGLFIRKRLTILPRGGHSRYV